jgi:RecA-family ATPase
MALVRFGEENKKPAPAPDKVLDFVDVASWQDQTVPERAWLVPNVIPLFNVTLLSGEGAIGKSNLLLHLCSATALAGDWLGFMPTPGPAIYLGAEDDTDELHRRLAKVAKAMRSSFGELAKTLHVISLAGRDAVLGAQNRLGRVQPTTLFNELLAFVRETKPKLIALDTAADIFAGNENDRSQVRQFVGMLRALAIAGNSAVLLASHPSVQGIHSDSGLSGSTAWHNSVRARLYLKNATNGDGSTTNGTRLLDMRKSNYGPMAKQIALKWDDGVFKPIGSLDSVSAAHVEQKAEDVFLRLLSRYVRDGRNVSDRNGRNAAWQAFADEPEAKAEALGVDALRKAMLRLFASEKIRMENYGRPSNPHRRMVATVLPL